MRYVPTFFSIVALVWASAMTLRSTRLPWIVSAYVIAQCAFALIAFLGLQRAILYTHLYTRFFFVTFGIVLVSALAFAMQQGLRAPTMGWLTIPFSLAHFGFLGFVLYRHLAHKGAVPSNVKLAIAQGAVLLACGMVASVSLAANLAPEEAVASLALGSFWLAMGGLMWCWSVGFLRNQQVWLTLNEFLPAFLAVIAFGWMAFELGRAQGELAPQALPHIARMERSVPQ